MNIENEKLKAQIKELKAEVVLLKRALKAVVKWIDFWESVPTPWKKGKKL